MTDPPRRPETDDDSGMRYDDESTTGVPRWVKVVGIVVAVLALLVAVVALTGVGGGHGPRRHGGDTGNTVPVGVMQGMIRQG
jgi:hypothetical protein